MQKKGRSEKINVLLFLNVSWPLVFGDLYGIVGKSIIAALFSGFTLVVILIGWNVIINDCVCVN